MISVLFEKNGDFDGISKICNHCAVQCDFHGALMYVVNLNLSFPVGAKNGERIHPRGVVHIG